MKAIAAIVIFSLFCLEACRKNNGTDVLTGNWELTSVYNTTMSAPVPRPATATGKFTIRFSDNDAFSGRTFKNTFNGSYTLSNNNELRFGVFDATKVQEDNWGNSFNRVLISCLLQSRYPCTPSIISIQDTELKISTPFNDQLTFRKIP